MTASSFDPIELELFKNIFVSIAEEMGAVLGRTSLSPNIKERKDFSCALFTQKGDTFAQGSHIPVHLGAMPLSVQACLESVDFSDGDMAILNDPYRGGTHLPDLTCVAPVFIDKKLEFFVANRAHHSDIGGMSAGSMPLATEIFQEGLVIPPVKLIRSDKKDPDIMSLILANVRTPEERKGDLLAQVAANQKGKQRLQETVRSFGLKKIIQYGQFIQNYTEGVLRQTIRAIPDGKYTASDFLDNDGITQKPIKIGVTVSIEGEQAEIDFSSSDPQVAGGVNANSAVTVSAVLYVFRSLVEEDIPFNTGLMKPLSLVIPEGSVVNAQYPSATAGGNVETSQRIVDVLLRALALAVPEKIPAASSGTMNNVAFGGFDPLRKTTFAYYETIGGGMGASCKLDGLGGIHTHMTNSLNTPIEAIENYLPMRVRKYGLRMGSGGSGFKRGGEGMIREYEFFVPTQVSIISERRKFAPYGLWGGKAGKRGKNTILTPKGKINLGSKANVKVQPGDVLRIETPGGGGYGKKKEG